MRYRLRLLERDRMRYRLRLLERGRMRYRLRLLERGRSATGFACLSAVQPAG